MFVGTGTLRKPREHAEARSLRKQGVSLKRIAARLGVSPTTVLLWTRDIELTEEQRQWNLRRPGGPRDPIAVKARAAAWRKRNQSRRRDYQAEGRTHARNKNPLHMAGCMLYWAEGAKGRNTLKLANSDTNLIRFFCRFVREVFDVPTDAFSVRLNVYMNNGLTIDEIENHWLESLDLPRSCLRKHSLDSMPTSSSGRRKNKLPYGVCTVSVYSTRIVQHIYGAIQEYAGFEEPRWLDGAYS
jgi:hypothetical protein